MTTLRLQAAADLLGMSPVTLRKRAAAGKVPGYKVGKPWVFLHDELLAYLKSTRRCPSIAAPTLRTGGVDSNSTAERSASQLALRIAARRKSLKRSRARARTDRSASVSVLPTAGRTPPADG
jgi:excisionase family DNA binding protein